MPRNPEKKKCAVEGCNAWAIRGSEPDSAGALSAARCSPHSGKVGAPAGNRNRLTHGFYATAVLPEELDDLGQDTIDNTLAAEIAITRVALRRIFRMLVTGRTPGPDPEHAACPGDSSGGGGSGRPLSAADYIRISALAFQGASAISRLPTVPVLSRPPCPSRHGWPGHQPRHPRHSSRSPGAIRGLSRELPGTVV